MRRASCASCLGVCGGERHRVGLERHPRADDVGPHVDVAGGVHVDGQAEPVEQLRTQFTFFGVHGADQHEPGLVAVRDPVAFDVHPTHRRGVEQHVDEVVVQKIDFVDIEHTAVRAGQQARREGVLAVAQYALQVQRADHPVLGRADGQLDQRRRPRPPVPESTCARREPPSTSPCPFSPRISTPPISGRTAHSTSASRNRSCPTIALNG